MPRGLSVLTNFVAELRTVVDEELEGSFTVVALLRDLGLDLLGIRAADGLGIARVVGATVGDQQSPPSIPRALPFLQTYPITLSTQAGVWTVLVPATTTLARAMTATARMDLLMNMMIRVRLSEGLERSRSESRGC